MKKSHAWIMASGIALLAGAIGYKFGVPGKDPESQLSATKPAIYGLVLTDLKGQAQSIGQWRGKILVINYWATWCYPCREEMPGFSRLQDKFRDNGVQFVGISIDTADKILEFQKETPVGYPLLIGDMNIMKSSADLGNSRQALPFTAVFDREGRLAMTKLGRWSEPDLDQQLRGLISQ